MVSTAKIASLLLLATSNVISAQKCYLKLYEICVAEGKDPGWELEVQLNYYNAKGEGNWYSLTNNEALDIPKNGCIDMNKVVFVPDSGDVLFQVIEEDLLKDDVYHILHTDACSFPVRLSSEHAS